MAAFVNIGFGNLVNSEKVVSVVCPDAVSYTHLDVYKRQAFMILTVSPGQVIPFICFLVILQQLEGNLIYPRVVGGSVGLPGMWILAAVTVGGGLWGILGMLIGVPLTATAYKLFSEYIHTREKKEEK